MMVRALPAGAGLLVLPGSWREGGREGGRDGAAAPLTDATTHLLSPAAQSGQGGQKGLKGLCRAGAPAIRPSWLDLAVQRLPTELAQQTRCPHLSPAAHGRGGGGGGGGEGKEKAPFLKVEWQKVP